MRTIASSLLTAALFVTMAMAQGQTPAQTNQNSGQAAASGQQGTTALPPARQKMGQGVTPQQRISREVMHRLLMNPYYTVFDNLAYKVQGNTVTLYGQVVDPGAKSDAISSVKKIEGVDKVNDQIEVLPPFSSDDQIRRAEYHAIFGFGGLYRYAMGAVPSIHIIVDRGHVKLVGYVDNQGDKQLAESQAKSVPGVFSVENDLIVLNQNATKEAKK